MFRTSWIHAAALSAAVLASAPCAEAQTFVKGTVVDSAGAGVGGADLDVFHQDGKESNTRNDGTASDGTFKTEVRDGPGTYDIVVNPPYGAALLPARLEDIVVVGTKDLGTITLADGLLVEGRAVDALGAPIAAVAVKVFESATGLQVSIPHGATDSLGEFKFAVPAGIYDVLLDPSGIASPLYAAAQRLDVDVSAGVQLGDLVLAPGFVISATCKRTGGSAIADLDVDVIDSATGEKLYTPGDSTDALGFVDVVVPAGTFDLQFEPNLAAKLVAQELLAQVITGTTNLGTLFFQSGVYLSGTVTAAATGVAVANVDVDVIDPATGFHFFLASDNTNAAGAYQVVIPTGTWDVDFEPATAVALAAQTHLGVFVNADQTENAALLDCGHGVHYGSGLAGSGGLIPTVASIGSPPRLGAIGVTIEIANALGGATAYFTLAVQPSNVPYKGGTILAAPSAAILVFFPLPLSGPVGVAGAGSVQLVDDIPDDPTIDGVHLYLQAIVGDPGATKKLAFTDGLDLTLCR